MDASVLDLVPCPEPGCTLPAEVVERFAVDSTCGPVSCLATRCLSGHQHRGVEA
jgi:hypothetical protein